MKIKFNLRFVRIFVTLLSIQFGCSSGAENSNVKKVFGPNEMLTVSNDLTNVPSQFKSVLNAVGKLSTHCTASHVGNGIVVTAGHCVGNQKTHRQNIACQDITIEWGLRETGVPNLVSGCETILSSDTSDRVDYAILKVTPFPVEKIEVSFINSPDDSSVTVFGHPEGRTLQWSGFCKIFEQGVPRILKQGFSHTCDTLVGSSGGPILTTESAVLTGIHIGGDTVSNYATNLADTRLSEFLNIGEP